MINPVLIRLVGQDGWILARFFFFFYVFIDLDSKKNQAKEWISIYEEKTNLQIKRKKKLFEWQENLVDTSYCISKRVKKYY